ncbi:class F sortase [Streptomyces sp. SL13]|uniref:Class F sortase n=1 Tax=Streptantibioticus silvisoli TaxID=2705255 RepID=A0AA90H1P6_9ACTN|nr:class F sortase [Streptantibioticus silvisoli]MDI5971724.1 class F sortase [Streptantibioticus silvisoli]
MIAATAFMAVSMIRHGGDGTPPPQPGAVDAPDAVATGPAAGTPQTDAPAVGAPAVGAATAGAPLGGEPADPAPAPATPQPSAAPAPLAFSAPTEVRIPALGVNAPLTTVASEPDGGIGAPPPAYKNLAGWYTDGPSPGERGTAVIDGHVDNMQGPAVFYGLGALHKGNTVQVTRSDGSTAVFTIYGVQVFAKDSFPGDEVYGDLGGPELRVITCGGGFTKKTGYDSNVVVFARLTAVH